MAEQRLLEASAATDKASADTKNSDLASDATTALRRAVISCKADPRALDGALREECMTGTLALLLKRAEKKPSRAQVMECLRGLLDRPVWVKVGTMDDLS